MNRLDSPLAYEKGCQCNHNLSACISLTFFSELMVIKSYVLHSYQAFSRKMDWLNPNKTNIATMQIFLRKNARPQVEFHLLETLFWYDKILTQQNNWDSALVYFLLEFDLSVMAWLTKLLERNVLWLKCQSGREQFRSMELFFVFPEL